MCYKFPGPRCSGHAYKTLIKAQAKWENAVGDDAKHKAWAELKDAQLQYDMTPKGQAALREQIASATSEEVDQLTARLEYGIAARAAALAEIKAEDKGDIAHRVRKTPVVVLTDEERLARNLSLHNERMAEWDAQSAKLAAENDFSNVPSSDWHRKKTLVFDLETTGVDSFEDRVVTGSVLEIYGDPFNPEKIVTREWLVNPGMDIPDGAAAVHGISSEKAREEGIDPHTAISEMTELLRREQAAGNAVIGYNVTYDFTMLDSEDRRNGVEPLNHDNLLIVDPLVIDYAKDTYRGGKRTLIKVSEVYGVEEFDAHNSSADCLASAQLADRMVTTYYPELRIPPETLMSIQRNWQKKWGDEKNEYAISRDRTPDYSTTVGIRTR